MSEIRREDLDAETVRGMERYTRNPWEQRMVTEETLSEWSDTEWTLAEF